MSKVNQRSGIILSIHSHFFRRKINKTSAKQQGNRTLNEGVFISICWTALTWPSVSVEQLNQLRNNDCTVAAHNDNIAHDMPGMLPAPVTPFESLGLQNDIPSLIVTLSFSWSLARQSHNCWVSNSKYQTRCCRCWDQRSVAHSGVVVNLALSLSGNEAALQPVAPRQTAYHCN